MVVKPIVLIILGLNIRNRNKLPADGPAIIAANHNSHLDALVLMSLYPLSQIHKIRPVAAADYFLSNRLLAWFSLDVIGIIPLTRSGAVDKNSLFTECHQALDHGEILLLFPEGSRGQPEQLGEFKKGIFYLIQARQNTPVIPVVLHGLGRALPRGEALLVPFNCDVIIGDALSSKDYENANLFINKLAVTYEELFEYCITKNELE